MDVRGGNVVEMICRWAPRKYNLDACQNHTDYSHNKRFPVARVGNKLCKCNDEIDLGNKCTRREGTYDKSV